MVDLVKIRKKAKSLAPTERSGTGGEGGTQPEANAPSAPPVEAPPVEAEPLRTTPPPGSLPLGRDDTPGRDLGDDKLARFMENAGKRREGFIAAEAVTATEEQLELLTFHIAGEQYALDIEHIVEIVHPRESTRVPNADESIVGIISLRGTIVTIVDVRRRLRHPSAQTAGPDARVVVVQYGGETIGFQVDRVLRVVKVDRTAVEPHPVVHTSELSEAIRGVFRQANALTILLDFDKLLDARHGTYL